MLPVFEFEASGDSNLTVGPLFDIFGDRRAGDGEFGEVEEDEQAVVVETDEVEQFEVDLVELDGDANEGEVDSERFGLPILFRLYPIIEMDWLFVDAFGSFVFEG